MTLHVFTGTTMRQQEVCERLQDVRVHPPIKRDDLLKLNCSAQDQILIIDGYFEKKPSVAHYEIIDLLDQGVAIYGAASMGALRAAELEMVGMQGIGLIFAMYRAGFIEGDDEVALLHTEDFQILTVPLIDLRILLQKLTQNEIINASKAGNIIDELTMYCYQERHFPLVKKVLAQHLDEKLVQQILFQLKNKEDSQKYLDARHAVNLFVAKTNLIQFPNTCYRSRAKKLIKESKLREAS